MPTATRALALCLALLALGCGGLDKDPQAPEAGALKIGFMYNLSQGQTNYPAEQGAQLAAAEINEAGGVNGQRIQVLVNGDQPNSASGLLGTRALLDAGVVGIVGAPNSALHLAMVQVTAPAGVPLVSYDATSPALTTLAVGGAKISGDLSWRTAPSDALQGRVLAAKIRDRGITTMGVLYRDDPYGRGLLASFEARFQDLGGSVTARSSYPPSKASGFTDEVRALFSAGVPQGVLLITFEEDGAALTWELEAAHPNPRPAYFGSDGVQDATFLKNAAPSIAEGMYGTTASAPDTPASRRFAAAIQAATGDAPSHTAAYAYDAVYLMALAMAAGGHNGPQAIRANLREVSGGLQDGGAVVAPGEFQRAVSILNSGGRINFDGASSRIDFDANGDPTQAFYAWWRIRQGAFETVDTLSVE